SICLGSVTAASVAMKGRYLRATDSEETSSKTIARLRDMTQIVGLFMAPLRTLAPPLFGLRDGEPRDKNDSVQAQTATCEHLLQWEFLSSSCSGQHRSLEKYRWSHRRPRHKCAGANRHKKYHRRLRGCPSWPPLYRIRCRRRRVSRVFETRQTAGDAFRRVPLENWP